MPKNVYICWTRYQRRPESLQSAFDLKIFFVAPISERRIVKFPGYLLSALRTFRVIVRTQPDTLWLQLAPSLLLYPAFLFKLFVRRDMLIIADCHNGILRSKWLKLPFVKKLLFQCDLVFFHNAVVLARAQQLGISGPNVQLLHTPPAIPGIRSIRSPNMATRMEAGFVLMPASFSGDEPIGVVVEAAARLPDLTFVLTGDLTIAHRNHDLRKWPQNVIVTGYLSAAELDWLLTYASVVLALTTHPDIELSAGNEALGFSKPLVASDSLVSRELFGGYAVFVDPLSSDSLTTGIEHALRDRSVDSCIEALRGRRAALTHRETEAVAAHLARGLVRSCTVL